MEVINLSLVNQGRVELRSCEQQQINQIKTAKESTETQFDESPSIGSSFLIKNILNLADSSNSELVQINCDLPATNDKGVWLERCQLAPIDLRTTEESSKEQRFLLEGEFAEEEVRKGKLGERRRIRTMFSEWQLASLEWRFARNKYLTTNDRQRIAKLLQLDQLQVKTWFQVSSELYKSRTRSSLGDDK